MPMSYVTTNLIKQLEILEPFGNGNEKPNFAQKDLVVQNIIPMGKNGDMARVKVEEYLSKYPGDKAVIREQQFLNH